jgi:hypothetical protein
MDSIHSLTDSTEIRKVREENEVVFLRFAFPIRYVHSIPELYLRNLGKKKRRSQDRDVNVSKKWRVTIDCGVHSSSTTG